jgi:hypothetical protein
MVALAQARSAAEIRVPALMLADEHIHSHLAQACDAEVAGEVAIGHHHIAVCELVHQAPQQRSLAAVLALAGAAGPLQHGAAGQRDDAEQARQWKAQPGLLPPGLRESVLVLLRVGHRHGGAIDQFDGSAAPQPRRRLPRTQPRSDLASQPLDQAQGQASPRLAVGTGVQAARHLAQGHPRAQPAGHGVLAAVIGTQDLLDEQHQGGERTIQAFAPGSSLFEHRVLEHLSREHFAQCLARRLHKAGTKPPNLLDHTSFLATIHLG